MSKVFFVCWFDWLVWKWECVCFHLDMAAGDGQIYSSLSVHVNLLNSYRMSIVHTRIHRIVGGSNIFSHAEREICCSCCCVFTVLLATIEHIDCIAIHSMETSVYRVQRKPQTDRSYISNDFSLISIVGFAFFTCWCVCVCCGCRFFHRIFCHSSFKFRIWIIIVDMWENVRF